MTDNKELVERVARVIWEHSGNGCSVPDEEQTAKAAIDVMQNHFPDVGKMVEQQTLMDEMAEALEVQIDLSEKRKDFGEFYLQACDALAGYYRKMMGVE